MRNLRDWFSLPAESSTADWQETLETLSAEDEDLRDDVAILAQDDQAASQYHRVHNQYAILADARKKLMAHGFADQHNWDQRLVEFEGEN